MASFLDEFVEDQGREVFEQGLVPSKDASTIQAVAKWQVQASPAMREKVLTGMAAKRWQKNTVWNKLGYVREEREAVEARAAGGDGDGAEHEPGHGQIFWKTHPQIKEADPYRTRALPDTQDWKEVLRYHRRQGTQFTDTTFPPNMSSIYVDPDSPRDANLAKLQDKIQWVRIADIFRRDSYIRISFTDVAQFRLAGFRHLDRERFEGVPPRLMQQHAHFAQKAAAIARAGLLQPDHDEAIVREYGEQEITRWFVEHKVFQNLAEEMTPLTFSGVVKHRVDVEQEPGYADVVHVALHMRFESSHIRLFDRANPLHPLVEPGDVRQGSLGDCYFLGALSVLSTRQQQLLDVFPDIDETLHVKHRTREDEDDVEEDTAIATEQQYNAEGVYAVRFWREGKWRVVVVDDYIPCDEDKRPVFARPPRDSAEIWAMIAEKAYAKLNGSYEAIVAGHESEALQDLTGGLPITVALQGEDVPERFLGEDGRDQLWSFLRDLLAEGSTVGCSLHLPNNADATVNNIMTNHAYGVLRAEEVHQGGINARIVQIRNPWGSGAEWDGAWSDGDARWDALPRRLQRQLSHREEEDGTWWMDLNDWASTFTELSVCRFLDKRVWYHHEVHGEWTGANAAGSKNLHLNPQFHLTISQDCDCYVEVRQASRRPRGQIRYTKHVAPVVLRNAEEGKRQIHTSENVVKCGTFISARSCVIHIQLRASDGPFAIIPAAYESGDEGTFVLEIYTEGPSTLTPLPDDDLPLCPQCGHLLTFPTRTITSSSDADAGAGGEGEGGEGDGSGADGSAPKTTTVVLHRDCHAEWERAHASKCAHCHEAIVHNSRFSGRFYVLNATEDDLDEDTGRRRGHDNGGGHDGSEQLKINGPVKVHSECYTSYSAAIAPRCIQCSQPIVQNEVFSGKFYRLKDAHGRVHAECYQDYQELTADRCIQCQQPVIKTGHFSGRYYEDGDGKVHSECYDAYREAHAERCVHCRGPIVHNVRYSGKFFELEGGRGQVHSECYQDYQISQAPKCEECGEAVTKVPGRFSGRYYPAQARGKPPGNRDGKIHAECRQHWLERTADKCDSCRQPILADGAHSGRYYELSGGVKVHEECFDTYNRRR